MTVVRTNFSQLKVHDAQLVRLGMLAERYFADDPNTALLKLRQLAELLAQLVAAKVGLFTSPDEPQFALLRRLEDRGILPREIAQLFGEVRRAGNDATHELRGDHRTALATLKVAWQLGLWFHRTFADAGYRSGPFVPPAPPAAHDRETESLRAELATLRDALEAHRAGHQDAVERLASTEAELRAAQDEKTFWEQMALETEQAKAALEQKLAAGQAEGAALPKRTLDAWVAAAGTAASAVVLDEAETRRLIDRQLKDAGWTADTARITYANGARPVKGQNLAIAEWPTASGPADYVLFAGLVPLAVVEAKRKNLDVSANLKQAERYSRSFGAPEDLESPGGPWGEFRIPFAFSANGRPYLRQLETKSGIWFRDLRKPDNLSHALDGWYTPEGLRALAKRDEEQAHELLRDEPFDYGFTLRPYQIAAIREIEAEIGKGRREMLVAMATGTGKTKTCIALLYRLLKTQRFGRVLFLVDRESLGEQAGNAFHDTRMESLQTFSQVFGLKELDDKSPDTETNVHLATIQGMVRRLLYAKEGAAPPPVDQYDLIVVDECHRGYLIDRELSDTEQLFRGFDDYISKYRRVLDHFDAVKIGLTATPALHTTQIFGPPIVNYSYREAVIDGFLVDHEPPVQIHTQLSTEGIVWRAGEEVKVYDPRQHQVELFTTPDEIQIDVEGFNRRVITKAFNRVVCETLAQEIDPSSRAKTLIFCVDNPHADLVVDLLKKAFQERYGSVPDDAVQKITHEAHDPLGLIRRYKNELLPNVAVTVDLLTTGIDVPQICNLVFLRRVNSRILFDQMLGRATRLCKEIGKETFRVFDAVRIYETLHDLTAMQPVVVDPSIPFSQLCRELAEVATDDERSLVRDQFLAKLQRKKHHLSEAQRQDFEALAGLSPEDFLRTLRTMPLPEIAATFRRLAPLGAILDRPGDGARPPLYVSEHPDSLVAVERGYGQGTKPEDYLQAFAAYLQSHRNEIPALLTVLTRPRELTRKQLRELALQLDRAGYSEASLSTAWREMTNQDIAARIVGYIRQAAIGDPLIPYEQRVDRALQKTLAARSWTTPQRQWLAKIAAQTKANLIVDRAALEDPDLVFQREGGGFPRLNRLFDGELEQVLDRFNDSLWSDAA